MIFSDNEWNMRETKSIPREKIYFLEEYLAKGEETSVEKND